MCVCLGFESCETMISEGAKSVGVFVLFLFFGVLKRRPPKQDTIVAGFPNQVKVYLLGQHIVINIESHY